MDRTDIKCKEGEDPFDETATEDNLFCSGPRPHSRVYWADTVEPRPETRERSAARARQTRPQVQPLSLPLHHVPRRTRHNRHRPGRLYPGAFSLPSLGNRSHRGSTLRLTRHPAFALLASL